MQSCICHLTSSALIGMSNVSVSSSSLRIRMQCNDKFSYMPGAIALDASPSVTYVQSPLKFIANVTTSLLTSNSARIKLHSPSGAYPGGNNPLPRITHELPNVNQASLFPSVNEVIIVLPSFVYAIAVEEGGGALSSESITSTTSDG